MNALRAAPLLVAILTLVASSAEAQPCRSGASALSDARGIAGVRATIARQCPCGFYDGSTSAKKHGKFVKCASTVIDDAADGTPLLGGYSLRKECRSEVRKIYARAACGYATARVMCCEATPGSKKASAKKASKCVNSSSGLVTRNVCYSSPFGPDACSGNATNACARPVIQETVNIPSAAQPARTPGSPSVVVTNPKLLAQFGGGSFSLNNARYTRYFAAGPATQPDAVAIFVPGFEGGASDFKILAELAIPRAQAEGFTLEVWAFDRRSNQLEDATGLDIAEEFLDADIGLDWLFGGELTLSLNPLLVAGPNRRAVFYDAQADIPFFANWTNLVFSQDIDAVVDAARAVATNQNVFLGGHSAGTGFTARYAATDLNLTGAGPANPGYAKLRGLVLLEGGGGSTGGTPLTTDSLDRIEAKFDGGLFGAVRDNAPRCVDGTTPCTIANEATDCSGQIPPKCTPPVTAYSVSAILNPRILAVGELAGIQGVLDPDGTEQNSRVDQPVSAPIPGNNAVAKVPNLANLATLGHNTSHGGLGSFIDDDGVVASLASFVATSVGGPGPVVGGLGTWQDITEGPLPPALLPDNGPAPTTLPGARWGQEKEVTLLSRMAENFYLGDTNFTDLYFPSSGLGLTSVAGVCTAGFCSAGNVGASCSTGPECSQAVNLDSSALSIGRTRRDIENLTQAASIDIPVISFGGTNGLTPVAGAYTPFGSSIGVCAAPSCDGSTARVVDATTPNPAFPTFGDIPGGYEVVLAEGFAHLDVVTAEDGPDNPIPAALVAFLKRNLQ